MAVAQTIDRRSGSVADERTNEPPAEVDAAIDSTFEKLETRQSSFHSVNILFNSCLATGDYLPSFFDPAFERWLAPRRTRRRDAMLGRTPSHRAQLKPPQSRTETDDRSGDGERARA